MIFELLVAFQVKHFLADYPLQTPYMLQKFKKDGWILPLSAHAGVHAFFTLLICIAAMWNVRGPSSLFAPVALALLDFVVHFIMDRIKASPDLLGRFKALTAKDFPTATAEQKKSNTYFWWALGLDQMVHHITHYVIIYLLVSV